MEGLGDLARFFGFPDSKSESFVGFPAVSGVTFTVCGLTLNLSFGDGIDLSPVGDRGRFLDALLGDLLQDRE